VCESKDVIQYTLSKNAVQPVVSQPAPLQAVTSRTPQLEMCFIVKNILCSEFTGKFVEFNIISDSVCSYYFLRLGPNPSEQRWNSACFNYGWSGWYGWKWRQRRNAGTHSNHQVFQDTNYMHVQWQVEEMLDMPRTLRQGCYKCFWKSWNKVRHGLFLNTWLQFSVMATFPCGSDHTSYY